MSFDAFLSQSCTIMRDTASGEDRYNNAALAPIVVATNVSCRKTQKNMRMLDPATGEYANVHVDLVLFAPGTDVMTGDRLIIATQEWRAGQMLSRQGMSEQRHISVLVEAL